MTPEEIAAAKAEQDKLDGKEGTQDAPDTTGDNKSSPSGDLNIALKQSREQLKAFKEQSQKESKEINDKLKGFEDAELERVEKKKIKDGRHLDIITQLKEDLEQANVKVKLFDEYQLNLTTTHEAELVDLVKEIPQEVQDRYSKIVESLDLNQKVDFYKTIIEDIKGENFTTVPKEEGDKKSEGSTELDKLLQKRKDGTLGNSDKVRLMTLISQKQSK